MRREAGAAAARRIASFAKLGALSEHIVRVPMSIADSVKAVSVLIALSRGKSQDALTSVDDELAAIERRFGGVFEADAHLQRQVDALDRQIDEERKRLDDLEGRLQGESIGQMLSGPVDRFRRLLASEGIEARPVPDLVEVSDPAWAMALEMLLGAKREALLVPASRLNEEFGMLYENRCDLKALRY